MNNRIHIYIATFITLSYSQLVASIVVVDDFSTGSYSIGSSAFSSNTSSITSTIADSRTSTGSGSQCWASSIDVNIGLLQYSVTGEPAPGQRLSILYANDDGNLNLAGFSHFFLDVSSIMGTADIFVLFRGAHDRISSEIPFNLSESGQFYIPFTYMGVADPSSPSSVVFRIFPTSDDFSITLSSIAVIPEPSSAFMIALGALSIVVMRRRKQ